MATVGNRVDTKGLGSRVFLREKGFCCSFKRHCMRNPGTDGNLSITDIDKLHIIEGGWDEITLYNIRGGVG